MTLSSPGVTAPFENAIKDASPSPFPQLFPEHIKYNLRPVLGPKPTPSCVTDEGNQAPKSKAKKISEGSGGRTWTKTQILQDPPSPWGSVCPSPKTPVCQHGWQRWEKGHWEKGSPVEGDSQHLRQRRWPRHHSGFPECGTSPLSPKANAKEKNLTLKQQGLWPCKENLF